MDALMNEIFKHLTQRQKEVYILRKKGLSQLEVALELGTSQGYVSLTERKANNIVNGYLRVVEIAVNSSERNELFP